jgi:pimeloyl-ACP methyl ester carboxylesterase
MKRELLAIAMTPVSDQQGLVGPQRLYPFVDAAIAWPDTGRPDTVLLVCHPSGNFLNHYLMAPMTERGFAVCGLNARYLGSDAYLILEEVLLDVGAAVAALRERFERIVLIGNSGGGSTMAFFQSQAENPTITSTAAGDLIDLGDGRLPPADAFVALAAHPGRATVLTDALDPSVVDETDPYSVNAELDMFDPANGPPYAPDWLAAYRTAQARRNDSISRRVLEQLMDVRGRGFRDRAFVTYRTAADPRYLDLSIDPSDRSEGSLHGDPYQANFGTAGGLARFASLKSWLSQWSLSATQADGVRALSCVTVPVLIVSFDADQGVFPSYAQAYFDAVSHGNKRLVSVPGATHYLHAQPEQTEMTADVITEWLSESVGPPLSGRVQHEAA